MWQALKKWLQTPPEREAAHRLYTTLVARARNPFFYSQAGVPDTGEGRFEMIVLFVALADARLAAAGEGSKALRRQLAEVLVDDFDRSLREMGVGDLSVGKKVRTLAGSAHLRLRGYAECAVDPARCAGRLGTYLRQHTPSLEGLREEVLAQGIMRFLSELNAVPLPLLEKGFLDAEKTAPSAEASPR
ncbi:MAG: hypothetical protein J0L97_09020 [Alphaproteobacteria bacterium]|nr:hypothetical protein [Alphaproteobacteria bacterium]